MNIIISFAGLKSDHNSTPFALRRLAGSTVVGHNLARLFDLPIEKLILVVDSDKDEVESWVRTNAPTFPLHMVPATGVATPITALRNCSSLIDDNQLLFIAGNYIAGATYHDLVTSPLAASCLIQREQELVPTEVVPLDEAGFFTTGEPEKLARWAGSCWLRYGTELVKALEAAENQNNCGMDSLLCQLAAKGVKISTWQARYCLDTRSVEDMLHANARLLQLDHGTQDAIERSYAEDFTVLPPVFMHETAVIENSVIGPFVNLEANASVRNSIVRNSLIGTGTQITDAILEGSLIGDDARIKGLKSTVISDNGANVQLSDESN